MRTDYTYLVDKEFEKGRYYIGASDIPTLALMNTNYKQTPLKKYLEMKGELEPFRGNEYTKMGHIMEPIILKLALEKLGYEKNDIQNWFVCRNSDKLHNKFIDLTEARYDKFPELLAHADLIIPDDDIIIEAKNTGYFASKRKEKNGMRGFFLDGYDINDLSENGIPDKVYLQVQTQLMCYNAKTAYVSCLIDGNAHKLYGPIHPNHKVQEHILALAKRFWRCVEENIEPQPEIWDDVLLLNPAIDREKKIMIAGDKLETVQEMIERGKKLKERAKDIENELDDIKTALGVIMGENTLLETPEGKKLASMYETSRESISLSTIKKGNETLYNSLSDYINVSTSRIIKY